MANLNTVVMALALVLLSPLALATQELDEIYNYYALPQTLGSSGQPTAEQFAAIRAAGFDVVVNLAMPDSENALAEEGKFVSENSMTYIHIPVPWDAPKADHLAQFFGVMDAMTNQGKKVWVHCAANYRASAFSYKYLTLQKGMTAKDASTPLLTAWLPQMDENWRRIYDLTTAEIAP